MKKLRGLISLCLIISTLLSGCHNDGQETGNSAEETTAKTESTFGEMDNSTEASTEEAESEKDAVLKEAWLYLLQGIEDYNFGQYGYQVSACIQDFDPDSDSEIFGGLYYNRSKSYSLCFRMGGREWFTTSYSGTAWGNYSESIYLSNLKRNISVLDCRVEKEWNEDLSAEEKENIPQNRYIRCMLGVAGREFLSKNRTTEGEMTAELYLMEYQSKSEIGFWIFVEEQEPIYVTVDAASTIDLETDYQVDRKKAFSESVANEAQLKIKLEMTSGKPKIEGYWQVEEVTDFEKLPGGYGVTFLEPTDIDGDGLPEEIRQEQDEQGRDAWYLYTGNGEKILLYVKRHVGDVLQGIYLTDVTGDGVSDMVVKSLNHGASMESVYYSIWTGENGNWNRIPLVDSRFSEEYPWMKGKFENLYLKAERLSATQICVSTVGTDYSEVIELDSGVLDEIWAKDEGKTVWLSVVDGSTSDIKIYGDLVTGENRLGAVLRFGLAELSGRLIYCDGKWSLREISLRQVERVTPDFVGEALADTKAWQKELWLSLLQDAIISVDGEIEVYTEEKAGKTERLYRLPWTTKENIENIQVDIFQWTWGYHLIGTGGYIATEDGYRWQSGGNESLSNQKVTMADIQEGANLIIDVNDRLSQIGDWLKVETPGYAERCKVAELLLGAAMRYAAEQQAEKSGDFMRSMSVRIFLLESNHDLLKPEGELLLQFGEEALFKIRVSYDGSCVDKVTGYTVELEEESQPFYEIKEALCYDTTIKTSYLEEWKDTTWQVFLHYEESRHYNGSYGCFVDEPIVPEDYDGDGKTDRLFLMNNEHYLFLSRGQILHLGAAVNEYGREYSEMADVTGDGVDELVVIKGTPTTREVYSLVTILKKSDFGLEFLPIIDEMGQSSLMKNQMLSIPLLLERMDETHLKITQPMCEKSVICEASPELLDQWGLTDGPAGPLIGIAGGAKVTIKTDEATGKGILAVKGFAEYALLTFTEVCWEMEYVDGVWKVIDFYLPQQ